MVSEPGSSELGSSFRSSTNSLPCYFKPRRSFMVQPAVQPLQEEDVLIHGVQELSLVVLHSLMSVLKKEGHWKHVQAFPTLCPRRTFQEESCLLGSCGGGLKHGERRCFWHGGFKEKGQAKKEMLVLKPTAQLCPFMMRVALEVQGTSTGSLFVS